MEQIFYESTYYSKIKTLQNEIKLLVEKESERLFKVIISESKVVSELYERSTHEELEKIILFDKVKDYELFHVTIKNIRESIISYVNDLEICKSSNVSEISSDDNDQLEQK